MVSKTGLHGIQALVALGELHCDQYMGAVPLAKAIGAPQNYLGKLLQSLAKYDLVISQMGLGGGFRLNKPAEQISLFDVVDPLEHLSRWSCCFFGNDQCGRMDKCPVHERWGKVREDFLSFLKQTSIADLIKDKGRLVSIRGKI